VLNVLQEHTSRIQDTRRAYIALRQQKKDQRFARIAKTGIIGVIALLESMTAHPMTSTPKRNTHGMTMILI
tara:strand:- start:3300 stop:3512 length:213 start_codon:yes stop_codon:yes gene_type:complete